MKGYPFLSYIFLSYSMVSLAEGLGPASPASLLPPINSGQAQRNSVTPTNPSAAVTPEFDPIFDLEDPSTLLDLDQRAMSGAPAEKPLKPLKLLPTIKPQQVQTTPQKDPYDKKFEEVSRKLLPPLKNEAPRTTASANAAEAANLKFSEVPKLDPKKPLIPLLPLLATAKSNTPKSLENKGPTPFLPHPPLLAAKNPPPPVPPEPLSLLPMLGIAGQFPAVGREPASAPPAPAQVTQRLPLPKTIALAPLPGVPDIAIILSNNQFFPSKIRLKEGVETRLIFTTTNKKPAALVMERLHIQRWIAKEKEPVPASELDRARWEVNRELSASKMTEVVLDPKEGIYSFHDAISGASGEIEVEKK